MEWIKKIVNVFINHTDKEQKEFEKYNNQQVLSRIRLISIATLFVSIFWIYMDWIIIKNGADKIYSVTLIVMHILSEAISVAFLIFYNRLNGMGENKNYRIVYALVKLYVFLYIFFGTISSINSQRYTGNIYSYIILSLIAAVAFTLKPSYMLFTFVINHVIFLMGIAIMCNDIHLFLVKTVNATILAGAAFLLSFSFYRQRMLEFFYRKKLKQNEESFKKLFYLNPYPVFITRVEDGKIIEVSERACSLMGIDARKLDDFNNIDWYIKNDSRLDLLEELKEHHSTYNRIVEYDFNGKQMWVTANYELIDYRDEKCILTGIMDITEIKKAEEELSHYASTDALTGILNRRMGLKKLEELIEKAKYDFSEFVICFLDINNLKYVNDTYGHSEGDCYILTLCNIIKNELKENDIFFRMGGDEFVIVFRDKNESQVQYIWDKLMKKLNNRNQMGEKPYSIMASHGLFYYCTGMDIDLEQMIEKADKQMYEEKQRYRKEY